MEYTSQNLIENYLQRSLTTNEAAYVAGAIPAVRKWIDRKLWTTFQQVDPETRYYDGKGTKYIAIDPCTDITVVQHVDPYNASTYVYLTFEYAAKPFNDTVKREVTVRGSNFPKGHGNIAITATFSQYVDGTPEDIQMVATTLVAGLINLGIAAKYGGNIKREELEGHNIMYGTVQELFDQLSKANPLVSGVLELYREISLGE